MNCLARERKDKMESMRDLKHLGQEAAHGVTGPDLVSDGIKFMSECTTGN